MPTSSREDFVNGLLAVAAVIATPAAARYATVVVNADTGQILHSLNADTRNYPASLTKIMTLYMVFEGLKQGKLAMTQGELSDQLTIKSP